MKPIIYAVIALLVGIGFYINGADDQSEIENFEKNGVSVRGQIESGESHRTGRRSSSHNLTVNYTTKNGQDIKHIFQVTSSFYKSIGSDGVVTQPMVDVVYLESDPNKAMIKGGSDYNPELRFVGPALSLGALGFLGFRIKKRA